MATSLQADATVTKRGVGQLRLRLVIRSGQLVGTRDVDGASCKDLIGAAAVSLAVLLRSEDALGDQTSAGPAESAADGAARSAEAGAASPPTPAPTTTPAPSPPARRADAEKQPGLARRWHLLLLAPAAVVRIGPEPKPSVGLALGAGVSLDRWRFHAEAKLWAAQNATTTRLLDEYGAELERFSVGLRACRAVAGRVFELSPCALVSVQHLSVEGRGPHITPRTSGASWVAAGAGLQLRARVASWVSLLAGADGEVQFSRPKVSLDGVGSIDQLGPAAATFMLGSEWIL